MLFSKVGFLFTELVFELFDFFELVLDLILHFLNIAFEVLHLFACSNLGVFQGSQVVQSNLILCLCLGCSVLTPVTSVDSCILSGGKLI